MRDRPSPANAALGHFGRNRPPTARVSETDLLGEAGQEQLNQILGLLQDRRGVDPADHKPDSIQHTILRRMALNKYDKLSDYLPYLRDDSGEIEALQRDLQLTRTSFFRDPEAFEALKSVVYPAILNSRSPGGAIRIWVPGCSSGEEAYSHAITLLEYLGGSPTDFTIQIFGTDLSEPAVQQARRGIYEESICSDVSSPRLRRFFTAVKNGYRINKMVRNVCVFATQNVCTDPPFSRMDLVSCRNVLITMSPALQRRVIPRLYYALKPEGFLMVGDSETMIGTRVRLFEKADGKHEIYRKKKAHRPASLRFKVRNFYPPDPTCGPEVSPKDLSPDGPGLQNEAESLLLAKYAPAAAVVGENLQILHTRGVISRYLDLPPGRTELNLLKTARPSLALALQDAIRMTRQRNKMAVRKDNIQVDQAGRSSLVNIEVVRLDRSKGKNGNRKLLVVFEDVPVLHAPTKKKEIGSEHNALKGQVSQLRQELSAVKEYLQDTTEAQAASYESLRTANEEIQSRNEELQCSNAELESTNEELRTTNEELQAYRAELEVTNQELSAASDRVQRHDLQLTQAKNDIVHIPLVMLGPDLSVRRYTPPAESALGLTSSDIGRPITHLRTLANLQNLEALLHDVMRNAKPVQKEIQNTKGTWYRLRIMPYRTNGGEIDGAVLTLMDISDLKRSLGEMATGRAKLEETLRLMQSGLLVADAPSGKLQMGNNRLWEILGQDTRAEKNVLHYAARALAPDGAPLDPQKWAIARSLGGEVVTGEEIEWLRADGQNLSLTVNSAPIRDKEGKVVSVVATFIDMTYRRSAEHMLRVSEQMAATGRLAAALAHEINNPLEALTNLNYLLSREEVDGERRKYVDMARVELNRITHISKSLLGLYRSESKTESFRIRDVVNDVLEVFASKIASAKVRVVKRYEAAGVMHGSYTEIRQIFLNLVGNALEAMGQNGTLILRTSASRDWRDLSVRGFRISVTDDGCGIPRELRPRMFEPFFTTKGAKGNGLGLWVTKGIVHRYGGEIRVRSRVAPGKSGTMFSIFFPNATVVRSAKLKS